MPHINAGVVRRKFARVVSLGLLVWLASPPAPAATAPHGINDQTTGVLLRPVPTTAVYTQLPLGFEAIRAPAGHRTSFVARGNGYALLLTSTEAALALATPLPSQRFVADDRRGPRVTCTRESAILRMEFVGANDAPRMRGLDELPGKTNYFIGNNPDRWRKDVSRFARVRYEDIYPGIDLVFYGNGKNLKFDLVVAPGADADSIRLRFHGAETMTLARDGSLTLGIAGRTIVQRAPFAYQEIEGVRHAVPAEYSLDGPDLIRFRVGDHDTSRPLFIDPVLAYSTYFGGGNLDQGNALAVDSEGNVYLGGVTASVNLPTASSFQGAFGGFVDGFVAKVSADGSALLYSTYMGGTQADQVLDIVVDASGAVYVSGFTGSPNFPTSRALQPQFGGIFDGFVAKLDPTGSQLLYSTFLGGNSNDVAGGLAIDGEGNFLVVGGTSSTNFPTVHPIQAAFAGGIADIFLSKLSAAGDRLLFSTYLGGNDWDAASGIGIDASGNLHIGGLTGSLNFPTLSPLQARLGGITDAFVAGFKPDGSALTYASYLGGSGIEDTVNVDFDREGYTYVTGRTISPNFPVVNAYQPAFVGFRDAFVAKVDPTGSTLVYSTYLGGSGLDLLSGESGTGIAVDEEGRAYVAGVTNSLDFPMVDPIQGGLGGGVCGFSGTTLILCEDAFVAVFSASGKTLLFSTYLGGTSGDGGADITVDDRGNIYVTGFAYSTDFPMIGAFQPLPGGGTYDAFLAKITPLNHAPEAIAGPDSTLECGSLAGAPAILDGSGSTDEDSTVGTNDDIVSFQWFDDYGLPSEAFLGNGSILAVTFPLGLHVLTLRVTDAAGATSTDEVRITVADTGAPTLTLSLTPVLLWPPNHRMVDIAATAVATDLCGETRVILASITSSEPDDGAGDGATSGDIEVAATGESDFTFKVRAERDAGRAGRVYTVVYVATDRAGNMAAATSQVFVPHDQAGVTEPLLIELDETSAGTILHWAAVTGARSYNVIRGNLGPANDPSGALQVVTVECLASGITGVSTLGFEDGAVPPIGGAFYYVVEYDDGVPTGYGTESAADDRSVPPGPHCP